MPADCQSRVPFEPKKAYHWHGNRHKFQKLNTTVHPGLSDDEFRALFAKCGACGLIMARQVYGFHRCLDEEEVSDLTEVETEIDTD